MNQQTLDEAERLQVIVPRDDMPSTYEFHHALVHQTLLEEIGPAERAHLHSKCAEVLECQDPATADERADEIVRHLAAAGPLTDNAALARYSSVAQRP